MEAHTEALARLAETDHWLAERVGQRASISPKRERATSLVELGELLLRAQHTTVVADGWVDGLARVARGIAENFPHNIFWDLDYIAAHLLDLGDSDQIERSCALIEGLERGFGRHSTIGFRYVHDFSLGFDWARWVARAPEARHTVGPFDIDFLRYLDRRCAELVEQIARDDQKYPQLPPGAERNPFFFSRAPDDERKLHRALAADDLLPVQAWVTRGRTGWERDYAAIRERYARSLGIPPANQE